MEKLRFWFDFASPYAWLAYDELHRIAAAAGREVELKPALLWAILKEQDLPAPMAKEGRKAYMMADMRRSAEFMGVPLVLPEPFQISTHAAARLCHGLLQQDRDIAPLARALFVARFTEGADLSQIPVLQGIAGRLGIGAAEVEELVSATASREALALTNSAAVAAGIWGVPYISLGEEGFFGADRLAQLRWRLGV